MSQILDQHRSYQAVRNRLWNGQPPAERTERPMPVSPFAVAKLDHTGRCIAVIERARRQCANRSDAARRMRRQFLIEHPAELAPEIARLPFAERPPLWIRATGVRITGADVIRHVARYRGVRKDQMIGLSRNAQVVQARREAIFLITQLLPHMSLPQVGRMFGRDHTTVMYQVRREREIRGLPVDEGARPC